MTPVFFWANWIYSVRMHINDLSRREIINECKKIL